MRLEGKIVLVTGAGRGIGKAIAIGFAREGANVIAVSRTASEIEATANETRSLGAKALAIKADVSLAGDVQRVADAVAGDFGRLDVLVNNAALRMNQLGSKDSYTIPFTELTIEDWDSAVAVNLRGPFLCIKKLLPLMRESGGSIINVSAGGGKRTRNYLHETGDDGSAGTVPCGAECARDNRPSHRGAGVAGAKRAGGRARVAGEALISKH